MPFFERCVGYTICYARVYFFGEMETDGVDAYAETFRLDWETAETEPGKGDVEGCDYPHPECGKAFETCAVGIGT